MSGSTSLQGFRLSPHQECLWSLGHEEGWLPYVVQGVVRIAGEVDPRALARALDAVVRRYEILRTSYQSLAGMTLPLQVIDVDAGVKIAEVNLRGLAEGVRSQRLGECLDADRRSPFDPGRGPLLRARRLLLTDTSCLLTLTLSSLSADATSLANLVAEVSREYASAADRGKPPADAMQYADFSEWIHELSVSEGAREGHEYWRLQQLPGGPAPRLPFERVSLVAHPFRPEAVPVAVASSTRQALEGLTGGDSAGWSRLLLAAWQAFLLRLTGEREIVVRVAFDGRKYEELRGTLGCFSRHLPVIARGAGEDRFDQLLGRTGESLVEAARWQEYFVWSVVAGAGDLPGWRIAPLSFELCDLRASARSAEASFQLERVEACIDRFKLKLSCALTPSGPSLRLEYDASLFAACDAAGIARSLGALLDSVSRRPGALVAELDVLGSEERRRLLVELNQTAADFPRDLCLHEIFEQQVERTPERLAAREGERALSYAELNARANQLAWTLRRHGVGLEVPVAISSVRSLETLIGLLAILKTGGTYLPIEPGHPRERLAQIFADARPRLLLRTDGAAEGLGDLPVLRVRLNDWQAGGESPDNPWQSAAPESLAYVLFTSGTTGRPKGVMVPHRGLVNYLSWCTRAYPVEQGRGAPVHSSIGFDLTVTSLFSPLLVGGAVWLLPEASGNDGLGTALRDQGGFSLVKLTPAHLEMLLPAFESGDPEGCAGAMILGGEALWAESLAFWRERAPGTRWFNEYGPTETVVGCCVHEVRPEDPAQGPVPIGRPIANTSLYVLDDRMQPMPAGIAGELYVGGEGVVRGYLARPEVTAAVFVPDPFGDRAGSRLYRTGDLVRLLPDLNLEYIGRRDGQVKIRGYRIETGEVEAALCEHPGVAAAVVAARERERGDRRLVAFFVPGGRPAPSPGQLAEFLRHRLPDWMIPTVWQEIAALPLTANGKLDRAALLQLSDLHPPRHRRVAGARTPTEELVAAVWCEILGLEQVGGEDDFLELGGHSLMATRVLSRLRKIFAVDLPFRLLVDAPTLTRVASRIESELGKGRLVDSSPIERVDRSGPLPLSFMQQRLWFLDRLAPGSPVYNIPGALLLAGELDDGALRRVLGELVRRHEPLRTVFQVEAGLPVQRIAPALPFLLPVVDLSALREDGREAYARCLATEEARRPFDLVRGPLLRAVLLRLSARTHLLLFTLHHIVFDGWSMGILVSEVAALYAAFRDGQASPLPELPVQYADFAQWQSRRLQGEAMGPLLAYWLARLAGPLPVLDLPADRPRPPVLGARGAALSFSLPGELAAALRAFSRRHGATLFMTALTVFDTLLARYTGIEDILVGTPVAGRDRIETEQMIGLLINTLVLRTDLAGEPSFAEALVRVRETALEAHAHQELPFERLVQELQPERDASRTPVFQVLFALQNSPLQPLQLGELAATPLDLHTGTAKLDLALAMSELASGLAVSIEYGTDLFDPATVARMADHLRNLFAAAVASPAARISELPLLGDADVHQLVHEWNSALVAGPARGCIHHRVARQSLLAPDAVAVIAGEERLSYGALDRRAGRLARRLRSLGIGPESRVGVCLERSATMLVSLLGILKAGGAYVPLDPAYPAERITFMLEDSGARLVVTERTLAGRFDEGTELLLVDALEAEADPAGPFGEDGGAGEGNAAYVIYTSGSTGLPKGVVVTHGNVLRLFAATDAWFGFNAGDVWTLFHSFAFDFSVWEVWGALLHGGRLVVVPYLVSRSPEAFYALILREGVTVLNQTPSAFGSLLRVATEDASGVELPLRWVVFGGEALEFAKLRRWMERFGSSRPRLVNMYGITETTVHVTWRPLTAGDSYGSVASAIGQAIPDLSIRLLDPAGQPVPIGVRGELHVGGGGLARGYLGRPGLTAERFVPDPFGLSGERLYRSGDLARYRPDGDLEFLGRIDHQVKIRGFRIELGEVEAALAEHPGLREVVVDGWSETSGETRLAAWVVPAREPAPAAGELRDFLKRKLPDYMLPSVFIPLACLPVTPSGKVNRRSLPAPGAERLPSGSAFRAPETPLEQALAETWAKVLGLERVGIDDNFFGLGGDSMRTLQVVSQAGERGISLELRDLYNFQTVRDLAAHLAGKAVQEPAGGPAGSQRFEMVADDDRGLLPEGIEDAYPLTMMQAAMLYHMDLNPDYPLYHNVDSFHLEGRLVPEVFQRAVQHVVACHAVLRTSFDLTRFSQPLQLVHRHAELPVGVADLQALSGDAQRAVIDDYIESEKRRRFDSSRPPLLRFQIHVLAENRFQFTLTEFHPILDGWSLQSTFKELLQRYFALLRGRDLPVAQQRLAFRDYVRLEREALASGEHESYWMRKLEGFTFAELPRWPPAARRFAGRPIRTTYYEVPERVFHGLRLLAQRESAPLKSVFLAAHLKVLALLTGQRDVVAGLITHGRPEGMAAEDIRGLFLNTLPFRMGIPEGSWAELVRAVSANEQELIPFRRYPMPALQRKLGRKLFETEFNLTHFHVYQELDADEIDLRWLGGRELEETSFPLNVAFSLDPAATALRIIFLYHLQEMTGAQLQAIVGYYGATLADMAENFDGSHTVSPLSAAERHQMVLEWNDSRQEPADALLAHELFSAQAARAPEAVAVVAAEGRLTYGELERRADSLARRLVLQGVGADSVVALLAPRGLDFVTAVLAIFKAGGAYLPLHPAHPPHRHREVLASGGARLVLVAGELEKRRLPAIANLPPATHPALWRLEEALLLPAAGSPPGRRGTGGNLAYVIFTSGSTGRPKGAMVEQSGMLNHLLAKISTLQLSAADTVAQTASQCFDISVWQLLAALLVGGRVAIVADEVAHAPSSLLDEIESSGATVLEVVPSLLAAMVEATEKRSRTRPPLEALRWMIPTGETLPPPLCQRWLALYPAIPLLNAYGPTECSDDVTHHRLAEAPDAEAARIPIGRPIPNLRLHVLNGDLQPVPIGVAGQLHVGGSGVGRGYIGDPDRTAEAFIPDPLAQQPGARLYRTGDLARYLPHGEIEFLGRVDHQVKIRGYRIELGEIETALARHPRVREAIVLALPAGEGGDLRLVGYLAVGEQAPPEPLELRALLRETLPDYMIPAVFVPLAALPLNASGKVDRRALPALGETGDEVTPGFEVSLSAVEEILAGLWARLLGIARVRPRDDFFELGGHSLSATQLISRVRDSFQVELSLRTLLEDPTLAGQAARIETALKSGQVPVSLPLEPVARDGELPLSFSQERLWFLAQIDPASAAFNVPAAFRVRGPLDAAVLAQALSEVVRRHESLRTAFLAAGGRPRQAVAPPAALALPVADLAGIPPHLQGLEIRRLATEEAHRSFDLAAPPLLRARLLRLGAREHVVLFTIHHIVSDGWSMGVLVQEATTLYEAFALGRPSPLPELPLQYADFAHWQHRLMQGEGLLAQLTYWRRKLAGAPDLLALPTDRPRPEVRTFRGAQHVFPLPAGLSGELRALSRRHGSTLFMALLAAFQTFLHGLTGQEDIVVGTDVANRNRTELEGQIGFFINHLVLRTEFSGNPSFGELLRQVRDTCLGAYANQDLPFVRLVKDLKPKRSLSHMPLFQVLFVAQNAPAADLEVRDLQFQAIAFDFEISRFDLALFVNDTEQGLVITWNYSTELFDPSTIERFARLWQRLLEELVVQPEARLNRLELVVQSERELKIVETRQQDSPFKRLKTPQRRSVDLSAMNPVRSRPLVAGQPLPLLAEPAGVEVDLAHWAQDHRDDLDTWLASHGAILFRGFGLGSVAEFEHCASAICPALFGDYGDLPREQGAEKVYHSTPYPADKPILFHNESSHLDRWPMRQMFFCIEAASGGGETPIVDCREIYRRLDPAIVRRFEAKGLMYVRNFTDGLDVNWRDFFHTDDRARVEELCRFAGMRFEWREDGLETRQISPAVKQHPRSGEKVFFNQIQLHHPACLDPELRESLFAVFPAERLPRNVLYGDGTPIEAEIVRDILETYWQASVSFPWQAGDLLLLDNMLVAHARNPFVGPRKIVVAMGDLHELRAS